MMDATLRIKKISDVTQNTGNKCGSKRITYKGDPTVMPAYKIPVEYLVFNKYNGRIGTFVKTYERQYGTINAEKEEDKKKIVEFLWKSNEHRNKKTMSNLDKNGQREVGIVTKDGVIIDGNRRCMLLTKLAKDSHTNPTYFRAIVLPDNLQDNPREINKLETTYQMGVDQPVDYNPIEKYLKCKELSEENGFSNKEIANAMGEDSSKIEEYLKILKLMEDYLKANGYEGMYTVLSKDKVEGPFVDLYGILKKQEAGKRMQGRDWSPEKSDLDDLKKVYFDYVRAGFGTHKIRAIGNASKGQGFFSNEKIWENFSKKHFENIDPIAENEKTLNNLKDDAPNAGIDDIIKSRDKDWKDKVEDLLKANLGKTIRVLEDEQEANEPMILLERAKSALDAINTESKNFNQSLLDKVKKISSMSWEFKKILEKIK